MYFSKDTANPLWHQIFASSYNLSCTQASAPIKITISEKHLSAKILVFSIHKMKICSAWPRRFEIETSTSTYVARELSLLKATKIKLAFLQGFGESWLQLYSNCGIIQAVFKVFWKRELELTGHLHSIELQKE